MAYQTSSAPRRLVDPKGEPDSRAGHAGIPRGRSGQGFWGIAAGERRHLRVLIANEPQGGSDDLPRLVAGLGHAVIEWDPDAEGADALRRAQPDIALVRLGTPRALALIEEIAHIAACPVIAMLSGSTPGDVREAARCGAYAASLGATPAELQSAIEISTYRFADYHSLQGAFRRRATIEQAKGILMARHALDADSAFALLRNHSQTSGRKLADIATLIVDSHLLLPPAITQAPAGSRPPDAGAELPSLPYAGTRT